MIRLLVTKGNYMNCMRSLIGVDLDIYLIRIGLNKFYLQDTSPILGLSRAQ